MCRLVRVRGNGTMEAARLAATVGLVAMIESRLHLGRLPECCCQYGRLVGLLGGPSRRRMIVWTDWGNAPSHSLGLACCADSRKCFASCVVLLCGIKGVG
jgi:hypothetical protein